MKAVRALLRTKLYWGLLLICLIGALASPHSSSGSNIFLSYGNLTDVLRQVSITGLVATGMTMVILLGGIDLSVGSVMGFATIICAMLLTRSGWTAASIMGVPAATAVSFVAVASLARFVFGGKRGEFVRGQAQAIHSGVHLEMKRNLFLSAPRRRTQQRRESAQQPRIGRLVAGVRSSHQTGPLDLTFVHGRS